MRHRAAALVGPVGLVAGTAAVLAYDPFVDRDGLECPFHRTTGLLCPGCGATRAWWLVAHGDLPGALRHNVLLLPAVLWLGVTWFATWWPERSHRLPVWLRSPTLIPPRALTALGVVLVAFTVARNLGPFDWLAPPDALATVRDIRAGLEDR